MMATDTTDSPLPPRCGIGLRRAHYQDFMQGRPQVPWVEAVTENFLGAGGQNRAALLRVRENYPLALHGVEMCVGDTAPFSEAYLRGLKETVDQIEPNFVSDHLCWGSIGGSLAHDLLPLPHIPEAIAHVAGRVRRVQDLLGRQIALENVSSYARYAIDDMPEWEFLIAVAEAADCLILLDVNNVFVNAHNHSFDAHAFIDALPAKRVQQIHIAGHTDTGAHLLDTHVGPVPEGVWALYRRAIARMGPLPTLVEWDTDIPPIARVVAEAARADHEAQAALAAPVRRKHA